MLVMVSYSLKVSLDSSFLGIKCGLLVRSFPLVAKVCCNFDVNRSIGDRTALWFLILALCATISHFTQQYTFSRASAGLSDVLRKLSFKTMLRQDGMVH
jgi:hypothetical protein